ncbi:two-component response regulator-like APRR7 isoform X2 [Rutidosis leptorrhynchoides]|uniref:two-component response regulator-like APRR7 isoform X2 n=1 Tax=Rutidosis leptorrhynchoides TaxID=125765 RepID=UPI003A98DF90
MASRRGRGKGVVQQVNDQEDVNKFADNGPGSKDLSNGRVDVNNVQNGQNHTVVQGNGAPRGPQQLAQGSLVQWEKFLHVRSIKVMLVENDDCTRHIVTALLRNCNYEVIEAANGFHAWKILENLSNHIDIVLTEVAMPSFSGITLLCKIMSHKTRKNVPVIMMSSHDSMGLVFKCLSRGAVDFLVKPIRKNELKNLWQHVWRRCHSSSGSGSESGPHVQKSVNSKSNIGYDNSDNKDGDDNSSTDGGSDDGSGTQSSWTKQPVECVSPEADQIAENPEDPHNVGRGVQIEGEQGEPERTVDANMKVIDGSYGIIVGEVGLKRPRANEVDGLEVQNGYNILRHSELSAFTRYKMNSNDVKVAPGITGCHSQPKIRSNVVKEDFERNAHSDGYLIYKGSSEQVIPSKVDDITPASMPHQELHVQHIHHHHHVHHYHNIDIEQPSSNEDDCGLNNLAADATHCGSSNIMGRHVEESNVDVNAKSGNGDAGGSGSGNGTDHNHKSALREAALIKFRQKREVRCFQKKVRYQNRKKLAEQRPRVKGQFVKGTGCDSSSNAADG